MAEVLGTSKPSTLGELADLLEELIRYGQQAGAVHADHATGAWRLVVAMYRTGITGTALFAQLTSALKGRLQA